ncbi:23S rRNA (guanosine(2251)-2'-O)-methyltransferase RlmB [Leptospira langatensis]|uniref:23S rRNA (Guanosine(2251)-2'-O)-methyltransferase RlmB n=1 Tax=Leptospira langatensis TaxID=2484983 RepID=A0A5F1ZXP9_9LEPT|nr:23S rRNA (guanosine(2251)-2'-O)-methyltransferase RlmB [Leptospira langatensis]TGJ98540.1 23S rRNA (guanosine(2251)-2'-O)-methyltransferase RlmB [Leptospira langatensis]TGL43454.1 23S rRNA (guanosine(2251)-2'-O)-methyltransferase RlmB [Leptospira langatensis]
MSRSDYIYGRRNIREILERYLEQGSELPFQELWLTSGAKKELQDILSEIGSKIKIQEASPGKLDRMLPGVNHQGVLASRILLHTGDKRSFDEHLETCKGPILVLDRIQDPGNLGNILRTAECFGVETVLIPERDSSGITPVVEKVASGALAYLNVFRVGNLVQILEKLQKRNFWVVSTSDRGEEDWSKVPAWEELVILMGNEGEGLKRILMEKSDFTLRIPLHGHISSLNVTVATGIVLDRLKNRP